jgi:hypothetical protein
VGDVERLPKRIDDERLEDMPGQQVVREANARELIAILVVPSVKIVSIHD